MEIKEVLESVFTTDIPEGQRTQVVELMQCIECGCYVADTTAHTDWHQRLVEGITDSKHVRKHLAAAQKERENQLNAR